MIQDEVHPEYRTRVCFRRNLREAFEEDDPLSIEQQPDEGDLQPVASDVTEDDDSASYLVVLNLKCSGGLARGPSSSVRIDRLAYFLLNFAASSEPAVAFPAL